MPTLRWRILALANASDRRRRLLLQRRQSRALLRLNVDPYRDLPEMEFIKTFRLRKDLVRLLTADLIPLLARQRRRNGISPSLKVSENIDMESRMSSNFVVTLSDFVK